MKAALILIYDLLNLEMNLCIHGRALHSHSLILSNVHFLFLAFWAAVANVPMTYS